MKFCSDTPLEVQQLAEYCCGECHANEEGSGHETEYIDYQGQTYELCHPYRKAVRQLIAASTPPPPPTSEFRVETIQDGKPIHLSAEQSDEWLKKWLKEPPPDIE